MKSLIAVSTLALACLGSASWAAPVTGRPHVDDSSLSETDGRRILRESIVISAPREKVWSAWASSEGLRSWEAPVANIDLHVGGYLEASYDAKAHLGDAGNIKHEVLGYLPGELLVFRNVQTPKGFPHADLFSHVTTVIQLEDAGPGKTRVTVSGIGYGAGKDWDELYAFFHAGNAYLLEMLRAHFEGGPGPTGSAHAEPKTKGAE
jgi:uncharacterized protein YndB with AHSA1/START domain